MGGALGVFLRQMPARNATADGADDGMMAGVMAGHPADDRALDAALRLRGMTGHKKRDQERRDDGKLAHEIDPSKGRDASKAPTHAAPGWRGYGS